MAIIAAFTSGCFTNVMAVRTGRRHPPKPSDCVITWEDTDMAEAATRYETVGSVLIGSTARVDVDVSPKLKEAVRVKACQLGADAALVGINANSALGSSASVQLLRRRDASHPMPALPVVMVPGPSATP